MQPIEHYSARKFLFGGLAAAYLLMFAGLAASKVSADFASVESTLAVLSIVLLAFGVSVICRLERLSSALETVIVGTLLLFPVIAWTYMTVGVGMPVADAGLAAMDARLGFDWRAFIDFVDQRYYLAKFLGFCYATFLPQIFLLPIYFCLAGKQTHAYAIVFGFGLICLVASVISVWFPAAGAFTFFGLGLHDTLNINSKAAFSALEEFRAVHGQAEFVLNFDRAAGILTFPSVHTGVAGLCAWAAWKSVVLRYPLLIVNVGMAVSTISAGSHYLVDVISGLGLTGFAVAVSTAVFYRPAEKRSIVLAGVAGLAARMSGRMAGPGLNGVVESTPRSA